MSSVVLTILAILAAGGFTLRCRQQRSTVPALVAAVPVSPSSLLVRDFVRRIAIHR